MSTIVLFFKWLWSFSKGVFRENSDAFGTAFIFLNIAWILCTIMWFIGDFHDPSIEDKRWAFVGIHDHRVWLVYPLFVEIAIFVLIVAYGILWNFVSFLKSAHSDWRDYKARNDLRNR